MPWRLGPTKGAVSCEKPRGAANKHRSGGTRMGQPAWDNTQASIPEHIGYEKGTGGTETSKYPEEKKTTVIPQVAASERGRAQTQRM
jgi:hypothetical protein